MAQFIEPQLIHPESCLKLCLHNILGLQQHLIDLTCENRIMAAAIICITETWLQHDAPQHSTAMPGWTFQHKARSQSYDNIAPVSALQKGQHGGVGFYHKKMINCNIKFTL